MTIYREADLGNLSLIISSISGSKAEADCDDGLTGHSRGEDSDHLLRGGFCQPQFHQLLLHQEGDRIGES